MIHFTSSSSPNEIESGEFERQITTNTARMPSFSPLGNIFSKIILKLIPAGSFYECIIELGNKNQSHVDYVILYRELQNNQSQLQYFQQYF